MASANNNSENRSAVGDKKIPVFISAGDPSGDIAGSLLLKKLKERYPELKSFGLGGKRMAAEGQIQIVPGSELAVLGFWEVAAKFRFFRRLMHDTIKEIEAGQPKVAILIDYPGFNLRLAAAVRKIGIPVIYYVSPQIWAWGGRRIGAIKERVDLMLLILPFEKDIYDRAGVKNIFVGHYLLDDMEPGFVKAPYNPKSDLIALLPGSRPQEIERMLPAMIKSAEIISRKGSWRFAVGGIAGTVNYDTFLRNSPLPIEIRLGQTRPLIADSSLIITSSGTATLETGIIGRPMVVIYKTGWISYRIARSLVTVDKIALINICAGKKIVPELIQNMATPDKIASEALKLIDDNQQSLNIVSALNDVTDRLGGAGAAERAVAAIGEYL
ncbi:putative Lipid-A-disaccharide synthase [Candidatus Zixiibacteriota bacterium]|nr:putative Lipid-A-disaccharide synthase [candidate division Zixibacteria bacterium]